MSLGLIVYRIKGAFIRAPTPEQFQRFGAGDGVGATHPCSKCDRLGLIWGRSQSWCKYEKDAINNFARELVKYEQMRRVLPHQRHASPLVLSPDGTTPWRKPALDTFFKALLRAVVTPEEAARYSLHSFRIYLACALLAAKVDKETIKQMLRWRSDEAMVTQLRRTGGAAREARAISYF